MANDNPNYAKYVKGLVGYYTSYPFLCMYYKAKSTYLSFKNFKESDFNANEILPFLYLGDISDAYNKDALQKIGVTDIITLVPSISPCYTKDFDYLCVPLLDYRSEDLTPFINKVIDEIEKMRISKKKVLVHCMMGVSRSGSMVIAYLMKYRKMSYDAALKFVKRKRSKVCPNEAFEKQLRKFK